MIYALLGLAVFIALLVDTTKGLEDYANKLEDEIREEFDDEE